MMGRFRRHSAIKKLAICGATGGCFDLLDLVLDINRAHEQHYGAAKYEIVGFLDDRLPAGSLVAGYPVLGGFDDVKRLSQDICLVTALGSEKNYYRRGKVIDALATEGRWETLVHPTAVLSDFCALASGVIIHAFCKVAANVNVGRNTLILPHCIINHDCTIGAFTILNSGVNLSGGVRVGAHCYVGGSACVRNDVSIGDNALIGLGAVVTRTIAKGTLNMGVPSTSRGLVNEDTL